MRRKQLYAIILAGALAASSAPAAVFAAEGDVVATAETSEEIRLMERLQQLQKHRQKKHRQILQQLQRHRQNSTGAGSCSGYRGTGAGSSTGRADTADYRRDTGCTGNTCGRD